MSDTATYGRVGPPWWDEGTVALIGGGPSLCGFDFNRLRRPGWRIVGINQSMFDVPFCHAGISIDRPFIQNHRGRLEEIAKRLELFLAWPKTRPMPFPVPQATFLARIPRHGFSEELDSVHSLSTSGFSALNLALLKKAKRIILFGYDYGLRNGRHHYHDSHGRLYNRIFDSQWGSWSMRYNRTVDQLKTFGVEVLNATPGSAIGAFPIISHDEALS